MKAAIDTNILVYAEGLSRRAADLAKTDVARDLLHRLPPDTAVIPVQVLGELAHVLRRGGGLDRPSVRAAILRWRAFAAVAPPTTEDTLAGALELAADHGLQIFDAVILTAAAEAQCDYLLSEDLHPGFVHRGVTVANPFAGPLPPRLAALLG